MADTITPELVPDLGPLASVGAMLGVDLAGLAASLAGSPDDATLNDVSEAVDELREAVELLAGRLAPVLAVCEALTANAGKLRRFGIDLTV